MNENRGFIVKASTGLVVTLVLMIVALAIINVRANRYNAVSTLNDPPSVVGAVATPSAASQTMSTPAATGAAATPSVPATTPPATTPPATTAPATAPSTP